MDKKQLTILHLYPRDMNIYGDNGNILTLKKRMEWRDIDVKIVEYNPGDKFPSNVDIVVGGGGQDSGQLAIQSDLEIIGPKIIALAENNTPMLVICGLYQLFGKFFKTSTGEIINGIGLLDIETYGGNERLIGNIVTSSKQFGTIVGYENHSGQTYLGKDVLPLGDVIKGAGNNLADAQEGARYNNVIGSYLHGSLLPKNPKIADFLIEKALENKYKTSRLKVLDDSLAESARNIAIKRPR